MPVPELGRLGFGGGNLGNLYHAITEEAAWEALDAAWEAGIRYFDTAPHYGLGLSERRIGAFLATKPRGEYIISTKVGRLLRPNPEGADRLDDENFFAVPTDRKRVWDFTADGIRRSVDESLERIGLDSVDMLYLHDAEKGDLDAADATAYPAMIALREEGVVSAVGAGSMSVEALQRAADTAGLDVLMVAGRLTLLEQPALDGVVPAAAHNGIRIVAAGVFNSGLLASTMPPEDARYEYEPAPRELLARARRIARLCLDHGTDLPTAALQYTLRIAPVVNVVVGSARAEQVTDNARRMSAAVPDELWDVLAAEGLIPA